MQDEEAVESFKQCATLQSSNVVGYCWLGHTYNQLRRYGDAVNAYQQALNINPNHYDANFSCGIARLKHLSGALQQHTQINERLFARRLLGKTQQVSDEVTRAAGLVDYLS